MAYILQDLLYGVGNNAASPVMGGVSEKLSSRRDVKLSWLVDAILELSRDYRFEKLEKSGPVFTNATLNQYTFPITNFTLPADAIVNLVPSFWMYYTDPSLNPGSYTAGVQLRYKTIDALEPLFQSPGQPAYWTRYSGQIFIAPQPQYAYFFQFRYQVEHSFSTPFALTDTFLLPNEWKEIAEYAAAYRGSVNLRMLDYGKNYHNILYGDPNKSNDVGLIKARVSQMEGDITSSMALRSIRPLMTR